MAIFDKEKLDVISEEDLVDLSRASINKSLSIVDFDDAGKFFYITIDRVLFSNPVSTIKTVLDAHGFVPNLENILSCLDNFVFCVRASSSERGDGESTVIQANDYYPCIRFELPQKGRVGEVLQSFYNEIAKYQSVLANPNQQSFSGGPEVKKNKDLIAELAKLKEVNKELSNQVGVLTAHLSREQKSLSRASRAADSQGLLPENAKICRVDKVDLKRRIVQLRCKREVFEIPTHMLDRVPETDARCLITFDRVDNTPVGIIFFDNEELGGLERRTADLLYVEGTTFKARDSMRNEFQIAALNEIEAFTVATLKRGMKVVVSIADGYIVRFSMLSSTPSEYFNGRIQEKVLVYSLARNQLVNMKPHADSEWHQPESQR